MDNPSHSLDCLAIGAHPDDAELFAGATLALLAKHDRTVGILDLTRGESATRGTPKTRAKEAAKAAQLLGLTTRETLDLGDGDLANTPERRTELVAAIRRLRPQVILTHWPHDRHPDHRRAQELVRDATFFANVANFPAEGQRWQVQALVYFVGNTLSGDPKPDWIVDVSETFQAKIHSLEAYETQFRGESGDPSATYIASPDYWRQIEWRSRQWGHRIGGAHGEPFLFETPAHARHPFVQLLKAD